MSLHQKHRLLAKTRSLSIGAYTSKDKEGNVLERVKYFLCMDVWRVDLLLNVRAVAVSEGGGDVDVCLEVAEWAAHGDQLPHCHDVLLHRHPAWHSMDYVMSRRGTTMELTIIHIPLFNIFSCGMIIRLIRNILSLLVSTSSPSSPVISLPRWLTWDVLWSARLQRSGWRCAHCPAAAGGPPPRCPGPAPPGCRPGWHAPSHGTQAAPASAARSTDTQTTQYINKCTERSNICERSLRDRRGEIREKGEMRNKIVRNDWLEKHLFMTTPEQNKLAWIFYLKL